MIMNSNKMPLKRFLDGAIRSRHWRGRLGVGEILLHKIEPLEMSSDVERKFGRRYAKWKWSATYR